jgi:nucleoid-associated protein YgaU
VAQGQEVLDRAQEIEMRDAAKTVDGAVNFVKKYAARYPSVPKIQAEAVKRIDKIQTFAGINTTDVNQRFLVMSGFVKAVEVLNVPSGTIRDASNIIAPIQEPGATLTGTIREAPNTIAALKVPAGSPTFTVNENSLMPNMNPKGTPDVIDDTVKVAKGRKGREGKDSKTITFDLPAGRGYEATTLANLDALSKRKPSSAPSPEPDESVRFAYAPKPVEQHGEVTSGLVRGGKKVVEGVRTPATADETAVAAVDKPAEYTVEKGDNFWKIMERTYGKGTGQYWEALSDKNGMNGSPDLKVGKTLTLPRVLEVQGKEGAIKLERK